MLSWVDSHDAQKDRDRVMAEITLPHMLQLAKEHGCSRLPGSKLPHFSTSQGTCRRVCFVRRSLKYRLLEIQNQLTIARLRAQAVFDHSRLQPLRRAVESRLVVAMPNPRRSSTSRAPTCGGAPVHSQSCPRSCSPAGVRPCSVGEGVMR